MKLYVNGYLWDLILTNNWNDLVMEDGQATLGVTDKEKMCVFLYYGLRGALLRKVLMHEIGHVYMFSYGYYIPPEQEEFVCRFIDRYADLIVSDTDYVILNMFSL